MKLEDCKPGTRVRVFDRNQSKPFDSIIHYVDDNGMIKIKLYSGSFFPQQLRKLVKRKKRPEEIMCVFSKDGKWLGTFFDKTPELIEARKQNDREVWLMRGVKKL